MSYKTFRFRTGYESWSHTQGQMLTLRGGIYGYNTPKTFRNVKIVVLVEKAARASEIKGDTWTIQSTADLQKECQAMFEHEHYHQRPELIIRGKGRNIEHMFACMGCAPD
jgi:hypothetical protein